MTRSSRIVVFFLTIIVFFTVRQGVDAEMNPYHLPESVGVWSRPESPGKIDASTIFNYMNGAGELYLGYRFRRLEVFDYTSENQGNILVELYFMETSDDAFGLLSLDWGGEPASLGDAPADSPNAPSAPRSRALYGAGLLRIWADTLFIRILAHLETPASRQAVFALGEAAVHNRKAPPEPKSVSLLSPRVEPAWTLQSDRVSFFRSYLALNSIFYLSHENILNFDLSTEAVIASYERVSDAGERQRCRFMRVTYETPARAGDALNHFHDAYLPDRKKEFTADSPAKSPGLFEIEDGWVGYKRIDNHISIVFECPDRESAGEIILKNETDSGGFHGN